MKKLMAILFFVTASFPLKAQSLLDSVQDNNPVNQKIKGAFKSTRVINAHSIEMLPKGNLDFRIMHRFGFINSGLKEFFGLDNATMRMSFDYGISDNFTVGMGRSTFRKELDAFVKTRLLQQSKGSENIRLTIALAAGITIWTEPSLVENPDFSDRTAYYVQILAGRKFNSAFSFQISPIIVHTIQPVSEDDNNTILAVGGGGRIKISKRMAITFDYHYPFGNQNASFTNPTSIGLDIETGGHVFQLQFSNATGMNERAYITQTTGNFFQGDIRFGFNLSRIFELGKKTW